MELWQILILEYTNIDEKEIDEDAMPLRSTSSNSTATLFDKDEKNFLSQKFFELQGGPK